jgi:hypothetical protein
MGNRTDGTVQVLLQVVVVVHDGMKLRAEEQQQDNGSQVIGYGCP